MLRVIISFITIKMQQQEQQLAQRIVNECYRNLSYILNIGNR